MGLDSIFFSEKKTVRKSKGKRFKKWLVLSITLLIFAGVFIVYRSNAMNKHYGYKKGKGLNGDAGARVFESYPDIPASEGNPANNLSVNPKGHGNTEADHPTGKINFGEDIKGQEENADGEDEDIKGQEENADGEDEDIKGQEENAGGEDKDTWDTDKDDTGYKALKSELQNYISQLVGMYGIYFMDLKNGEQFGINAREKFLAASTFKIPLNMYIYKMIRGGEINPADTIEYTEDDYEEGAGIIRYNETFGKNYTVKELQRLSIVYSDNVAVNMLLRHVGRGNVKNYMRQLGGRIVDDNKNTSCPEDMALYLKKVYELYIMKDRYAKELVGNMIETNFCDRLPALLPKGVDVAHKTGNLIGIVHDVGIVFAKRPYIIVVMSKGVISDKDANNAIADISKKVYDFVKKSEV
jgi:beta-lactamase class A